ncbi:hypothetical protein K227x_02400 [Rubripirellula lacrimiformis]|uniref:Thioredoxin domain-containing protein n=1 Tax=Rubripirellula lacrimiformis TaxID=1930273 RepID=A0A517N409_9BACT|nr:TlpA disulfide reductase family protein [Rubripirellula lacrimiformis]QDT01871.1 hypothetical protein K227x_02400 [Rubripirellula lacrimiformis]
MGGAKSVALAVTVLALSVCAGCGGSSSSGSGSDAPPPAGDLAGSTTPAPAADPGDGAEVAEIVEAPGGIEFPADVSPAGQPESSNSAPAPGGFEMPADVSPNSQSSTGPASPAGGSPEVQYATWDEVRSRVSTSGKITVVDLWSLSCEPCLKEFPELVRLHQETGGKIQCVAVNLDFDGRKSRPPEHYLDQVTTFLASVGGGGFPAYICSTPSDDVYAAADIDSIPSVLIFDADGKQIQKFVDAGDTLGFTYQKDILPLLEKISG